MTNGPGAAPSGGKPREYVAFLRGINVGGSGAATMANLKAAFESLGFGGVRTVLASGNVVFVAEPRDGAALARDIGRGLPAATGIEGEVIVRSLAEIRALVAARPFAGVVLAPETRLYVTFLGEPSPRAKAYAAETAERDMRSFGLSAGEVASVVILSKTRGTPDLMRRLERAFGRGITTRAWSTIEKIAAA